MGRSLILMSVSDKNIDAVLNNPPSIWHFIAPGEDIYSEEQMKEGLVSSFVKPEFEYDKGEAKEDDLDKAWHGIHFLLTGSASAGEVPLDFLLAGTRVGDINVGYGPAKVFRSHEVAVINEALSKITKEEFESRYDSKKMTRQYIYPHEIWDPYGEEEKALAYISEYFDRLKLFISETASNNMGMIMHMM